ncbi:hypothetical protein M569_16965, partial [Genlisea aurea]
MQAGKHHQGEEEDEDEEFGARKDANRSKGFSDGKNDDKANAMRSKHSVTEQRRRSKINERYQILRGLIPNSDQKRDTASFLLEVIHYVQFLQEKVQKYEGSYQTWNSEPIKLMPWATGIPLQQPNSTTPAADDGAAFSHMLLQGGQPPPNECSGGGACPAPTNNHRDEPAIEGGTISISSVYSQGLLNSLTQALQTTGLDLSQSTISVQINLGKRVHRN